MLGGLLPTFVTLLSPQTQDIPLRLGAFIVGSVIVFLIAAGVSPETKGNLDRADAPEANPSSATGLDSANPATATA